MDQKLVDRLRRLAVVGMVSVLCGGSPVLAGSNPHGNPNCPGKSCEDHGNAKVDKVNDVLTRHDRARRLTVRDDVPSPSR